MQYICGNVTRIHSRLSTSIAAAIPPGSSRMIPKIKSARAGSVFQCGAAHIETAPTTCTTVKIVHARRLIFQCVGFSNFSELPFSKLISSLFASPGCHDYFTSFRSPAFCRTISPRSAYLIGPVQGASGRLSQRYEPVKKFTPVEARYSEH